MKAISLTQPWASLVILGAKKVETRSWKTSYRGPLLIHAAKAFPTEAVEFAMEEPCASILRAAGIIAACQLPRGAALGTANLVDCRYTGAGMFQAEWMDDLSRQERFFGNYASDRYGFSLENVQAFPKPITCRGALNLWTPSDDILAQIEGLVTA